MNPIAKYPDFATYYLNLNEEQYELVIHKETMMYNVSYLADQFSPNSFKEKIRSIKTVFILESLSRKLTGKPAITISGLTVSEAMSEENKTNPDIYDASKSYHRLKSSNIEFINSDFIRIIKTVPRNKPQFSTINGYYLDIRTLFVILCMMDPILSLYYEEIMKSMCIISGNNLLTSSEEILVNQKQMMKTKILIPRKQVMNWLNQILVLQILVLLEKI